MCYQQEHMQRTLERPCIERSIILELQSNGKQSCEGEAEHDTRDGSDQCLKLEEIPSQEPMWCEHRSHIYAPLSPDQHIMINSTMFFPYQALLQTGSTVYS